MTTSFTRFLLLMFLTSGLALADQSNSLSTTKSFYDWYQGTSMHYRDKFPQARPYFTSDLFDLLTRGFAQSHEQEFWVDFDPFVNAQMDAKKVSFSQPIVKGPGLEVILVTPYYDGGANGDIKGDPIKVWVKKDGADWKIANLVYGGDYPFELKTYLAEGLGR